MPTILTRDPGLILHITLVHFSVAQEKSLCNEEYFLLCYSHGVCNNIISIKKGLSWDSLEHLIMQYFFKIRVEIDLV